LVESGPNHNIALRDHQDRLDDTPVIVITALAGNGAAIEAMKLGAYDYISKPFDLDEVEGEKIDADSHNFLPERALADGVQLREL
jgi:DNA-binding NtrC family response regulator